LTESTTTAVAAQKIRHRNFKGSMVATIWAQSPQLVKIGGPATEGISLVSFIDPGNSRPEYLEFSEKLKKHFGKSASARSARAYEMIDILAHSLRSCQNINARELKNVLLDGRYNSILGSLTFDRFGDVIRPVYELVVRDGRLQNVGEIY